MIASVAADLRRYPRARLPISRTVYRRMRKWGIKSSVPPCRRTGSRRTLSYLAAEGPRYFYEGDLARSIAGRLCRRGGGALSVEDLASFRAYVREPLAIPYRGGQVYATPETHLRPDLAHALRLLAGEFAARARRTGCLGLHSLCAGSAIGVPGTPARYGRRGRPPRAGRRNIWHRHAPRISR